MASTARQDAPASGDIGPLAWVKSEIDLSLGEARELAAKIEQGQGDDKAQATIQSRLHEAQGAISMIGLAAAAQFAQGLETLAGHLQQAEGRAEKAGVLRRSIAALAGYLDMRAAGEPDNPFVLLQPFQDVCRASGAASVEEADLFFPNLDLAFNVPSATEPLNSQSVRMRTLTHQRTVYQQGLIKTIRGTDAREGLGLMHAAAYGMESVPADAKGRSFWQAVVAFFESLIYQGSELNAGARSLFTKVDWQLRELIAGRWMPNAKLHREVLLALARSKPVTERIAAIQDAYKLTELVQMPDTGQPAGLSESATEALRQVRERLTESKDAWLRFTSGQKDQLERFLRQSKALHEAAGALGLPALTELLRVLSEVGPFLAAKQMPASDAQALEVATSLLFAESTLEHYPRLGSDFTLQADAASDRVKAVMSGREVSSSSLLDDVSRRAQERLLLFQVAQELQVNLQTIETQLDAFFRDPEKREGLGATAREFGQIQGAFIILEHSEAAELSQVIARKVAAFASAEQSGTGEEAQAVAEGVSALSLYVEALKRGEIGARNVLIPALIRFGLIEPPAPEAMQVEETTAPTAFMPPPANLLTAEKTQILRPLMPTLDLAPPPPVEPLAPVEPPVATGAITMIDDSEPEVDAELLEIFLEEAAEVVYTIGENLEHLENDPSDRAPLTTIRRGYHTLKGSGRMVGLNDFGEVAWQCEQVLNKWLKDESPANPSLLHFIRESQHAFAGWVITLQEQGRASIDGSDIVDMAERLKLGESLVDKVAHADEPAGSLPLLEPIALTAAPEEVLPLAAAEEEVESDEVDVGSVRLSRDFFNIYRTEAEQHATALANEWMMLVEAPSGVVRHEFMRAAHTLASTSRTAGFDALADVAHGLEHWLQDAIEFKPQWSDDQRDTTQAAIEACVDMVDGLERHVAPEPRPDVIDALARLREQFAEYRRERQPELSLSQRMLLLRGDSDGATESALQETMRLQPVQPVPPVASIEVPAFVLPESEPINLEPAPLNVVREPVEPPVMPMPPVVPMSPVVAPAAFAPVTSPPAAATPAFAPAASTAPTPTPVTPAEREVGLEAVAERRVLQDDIDQDLLPIFLEEASELLPQADQALRAWRANTADATKAAELQRYLHTLKGSARMSGLMRLGELAHVSETKVIAMSTAAAVSDAEWDDIQDKIDRFSQGIERMQAGDLGPVDIPVAAELEQVGDKPVQFARLAAATQVAAEDTAQAIAAAKGGAPVAERQALLRVAAESVDRFVNQAGEMSIARSRVEGELVSFKRAMSDLLDNVNRMRAQLREIEIQAESQIQSSMKEREHVAKFDPLEFDRFTRMQELTRMMAESVNDLVTLQQGLQKNIDETDAALLAQARLNRDLQQGLMNVRLVPFANLSDRLYRVIRQTAKELGKKANLELRGTRVEMDRSVLEKITAPLEHLLRNAVAHGIERPEDRVAAGKAEIGEVNIDTQQLGNEVLMTVSDDGRGLNLARIRSKAIATGLMSADEEKTDAELAQFIFVAGFSTADEVSQIAGRGVGMDVVKNEIVGLGGRIELTSTPGKGLVFTITLPLTLAVTQAVMLQAGSLTFAVPSVMVEQVQEYKAAPYADVVMRGEVEFKGNRYPLRSLLPLLGEIDTPTRERQIPVLLLRSGAQRAAIRVDEIIGNREVVVKSIGPQLARMSGISGATVLGNGQVVLILNPVQLVHRGIAVVSTAGVTAPAPAAVPEAPAFFAQQTSAQPLVMVVDDSLTVRKITGRLLTREGFDVVTAKDGVDALQQLQDVVPDVILSDIEMPRMDGFELLRNIRADDKMRRIPVVMITSRIADKHRSHAFELGVNEYLGKPYQEEQLIALIRKFTEQKQTAQA